MKSSTKQIRYRDFTFQILPQVYEPAEDSFLAADNLHVKDSDDVLDMGTGCGILAIVAARNAHKVIATDINPHAVTCTEHNADINNLAHKIDVRRGSLFQPINRNEKFTVIVFNAPYLPCETNEERSWLTKSWAGGPTGRQLIDKFIKEAPKHLRRNGRILLVQSTLANTDETLKKLREERLHPKIIAGKKVAFETIVLVQASHLSHKPVRKPR